MTPLGVVWACVGWRSPLSEGDCAAELERAFACSAQTKVQVDAEAVIPKPMWEYINGLPRGVDYVWGGTGPDGAGLDVQALVQAAWARHERDVLDRLRQEFEANRARVFDDMMVVSLESARLRSMVVDLMVRVDELEGQLAKPSPVGVPAGGSTYPLGEALADDWAAPTGPPVRKMSRGPLARTETTVAAGGELTLDGLVRQATVAGMRRHIISPPDLPVMVGRVVEDVMAELRPAVRSIVFGAYQPCDFCSGLHGQHEPSCPTEVFG